MSTVTIQKNNIVNSSLIKDDEFIGLVSKINEKNRKFAEEINHLVLDSHIKSVMHLQRKGYNLLKYLLEKPDAYGTIIEYITNGNVKQNVKQVIEKSLSQNRNITDSQKKELTEWLSNQLNESTLQQQIKDKIEIKNSVVEYPTDKQYVSNILGGIFSNKIVLKVVSNHLFDFQKSIYKKSISRITEEITNIKLFSEDQIKSYTQNNKLYTPNNKLYTKNDKLYTQDNKLYDSKSTNARKYLISYNNFLVGAFIARILEIKNKNVDQISSNILSRNINKSIKPYINVLNPLLAIKKFKKLGTKRYWKNLKNKILKSTTRTFSKIAIGILGIPWFIAKSAGKIILNTGFGIISIVPDVLYQVVNIPIKIATGAYSLIKNILKLSFNLLKSVYQIGNGLLNRIKIFLMTPFGSYITGFIAGFLYQKLKNLYSKLIGYIDDIKEKLKENIADKDDELQKRFPKYKKLRESIDRFKKYAVEQCKKKEQEIHEIKKTIKLIDQSDNINDREKLELDLKKQIFGIFGLGDEQLDAGYNKTINAILKLDELANDIKGSEHWKGFVEAVGNFKTDILQEIQRISDHGGIGIEAKSVAANVGSRALCSIIGASIGSIFGPLGTIIGGGIGSFIGAFVGNSISKWISDIPYVGEKQQLRWKHIDTKYIGKNNNGNVINDAITNKDDKLKYEIIKLQKQILSGQDDNGNLLTKKQKIELQRKVEEQKLKYQNQNSDNVDYQSLYDNSSIFATHLQNLLQYKDGLPLGYCDPEDIVNYVLNDGKGIEKIHGVVNDIDIEKTPVEWRNRRFTIQNIFTNLIGLYQDGIIDYEQLNDILKQMINEYDSNVYVSWRKATTTNGLLDEIGEDGLVKESLPIFEFLKKYKNNWHHLENTSIIGKRKISKNFSKDNSELDFVDFSVSDFIKDSVEYSKDEYQEIGNKIVKYSDIIVDGAGKVFCKIDGKKIEIKNYIINEYGDILTENGRLLKRYYDVGYKMIYDPAHECYIWAWENGIKVYHKLGETVKVPLDFLSNWFYFFGDNCAEMYNNLKGNFDDAYKVYLSEGYKKQKMDNITGKENGVQSREHRMSLFSLQMLDTIRKIRGQTLTKEQKEVQLKKLYDKMVENGETENANIMMENALNEIIWSEKKRQIVNDEQSKFLDSDKFRSTIRNDNPNVILIKQEEQIEKSVSETGEG